MKSPEKLPFAEFKIIYSRVPRLCIDLAIKSDEGIVLIKRDIKPWQGMWHTPGGTLLMGEKIKDAIKRIAFHETGLKVKVIRHLGVVEFVGTKKGAYSHGVSLYYLVEPQKGTLRGSEQGEDVRYFRKLPDNLIKEQKEFLESQNLL